MAQKPENVFRASVHRYKPKRVHQEKTNNSFRGGIPDDYYESNGTPGTLWVEYKYTYKIPRNLTLTAKNAKPNLSRLQADWLDRAYHNGQQVAVIIGCSRGGIILTDRRWMEPITADYFETNLKTRKEVMEWIETKVTSNGYRCRSCQLAEKTENDVELPEQDALSGMGNLSNGLQDGE